MLRIVPVTPALIPLHVCLQELSFLFSSALSLPLVSQSIASVSISSSPSVPPLALLPPSTPKDGFSSSAIEKESTPQPSRSKSVSSPVRSNEGMKEFEEEEEEDEEDEEEMAAAFRVCGTV